MTAVASLPAAQPVADLSNLEAEQALLGALMIDNALLDALPVRIGPEHFAEPLHGRIYARVAAMIAEGRTATPPSIKPYFDGDEALRELGGIGYLARLTGDPMALIGYGEMARQVREAADRRTLRATLRDAIADCEDPDVPAEEVIAAVRAAADGIEPERTRLAALDLAALAETQPRPRRFLIDPIAPAGETTIFSAAGAAGKSLLAQQLATASAAGITSCLGMTVEAGHSLYLTAEDGPDELHWRQTRICKALGVDLSSLDGKLFLASLRGARNTHLATFAREGTLTPTGAFYQLANLIKHSGAQTAWLDNIAHLFAGDENDRGQVTRFVGLLNGLAEDTGAAIIALGHTNKGGASFSGSTAWLNAVRSQFTLDRDPETDVRTLKLGKSNYRRSGDDFRFIWIDGAFVAEGDVDPDMRTELAAVGRANSANDAFLNCLRERVKQGTERAVAAAPGRGFAPSEFEGMPQAKGFTKAELRLAMERLFATGKIATQEVKRAGNKGTKTIIVEGPE